MDIASFKNRYPDFVDDVEVANALNDAELLLSSFCISPEKIDLAHALLTAHILTAPQGATESAVTKVKAGSVEVDFSDKHVTATTDWLGMTSYGMTFKMLIRTVSKFKQIGMIVI